MPGVHPPLKATPSWAGMDGRTQPPGASFKGGYNEASLQGRRDGYRFFGHGTRTGSFGFVPLGCNTFGYDTFGLSYDTFG